MIRPKPIPYQRQAKQQNNNKKTAKMSKSATILELPMGTVLLDNQVAGHTFEEGKDSIGMLKDSNDGSLMKPAYKPICGLREIQFYEQLKNLTEPNLCILRKLVPEYKGTKKLKMGDRSIDFIKLADITHGMTEPCIIDIKIGKRTWDPLANEAKIVAEQEKYRNCKENLGFCIPGFQVYSVKTGSLKKYGKEYGKKLNEHTMKDALKVFLNAEHGGFSRTLIMHILSELWNIQNFARAQKHFKFYSSSILIAYDARCLRNSMEANKKSNSNNSLNFSSDGGSQGSTNSSPQNGKLTTGGFAWPIKPTETIPVYKQLQRSHSTQNNYDEDLKSIRENYNFMLGNLIEGNNDNTKAWAFVKMIDFAHVFPTEDDALDTNYLFGIENLVKFFELFLDESEM